jgi:hypothetical protein
MSEIGWLRSSPMDSEVTWSIEELQDLEGFNLHLFLPGDEFPFCRITFSNPHEGKYELMAVDNLATGVRLQVARQTLIDEFRRAFSRADPKDESTAGQVFFEDVYRTLTYLGWPEKRPLQVAIQEPLQRKAKHPEDADEKRPAPPGMTPADHASSEDWPSRVKEWASMQFIRLVISSFLALLAVGGLLLLVDLVFRIAALLEGVPWGKMGTLEFEFRLWPSGFKTGFLLAFFCFAWGAIWTALSRVYR